MRVKSPEITSVNQKRPLPHQPTTGLAQEQFTTLLTALTHHITWGKPGGRPPALTLTQALKATLLYHRYNLTEELLSGIFSTSQHTISRTINLIEGTLRKILKPAVVPLEKALKVSGSLIVDGILIPVWNWRSLGAISFSGERKRAGFNHQVICTLSGRLLAITIPLPEARHDAYAYRFH